MSHSPVAIVLVCETCGRRSSVPAHGADWVCRCGETDYRVVVVVLEDRKRNTEKGPNR